MKCLVFSDSHGSSLLMEKALDMHRDAEVVFFLGDGLYEAESLAVKYPLVSFICVKGNCDAYTDFSGSAVKKTEAVNLMGYNIVLTHGDLYGAKSGKEGLVSLANAREADVLLFGHTHIPELSYLTELKKPLYLFNPGSISLREGSFGIMTLGKTPLFSHGKLNRY